MECDFSGYVTKAGLKCSDGRTIMPGAFKHQDKMQVPLVWQHGHTDPENVLGHVLLENRADGVYGYAHFNKTKKAEHAKQLLEHKDINMMSIWANQLLEKGKSVFHGMIREVSLVLAGANPGALIENVTIRHADGEEEVLEDELILFSELSHADEGGDGDANKSEDDDDDKDDGKSVADVIESMTEEQKQVLHYMVGEALEAKSTTTSDDDSGDNAEHSNTKKDQTQMGMKHNVFESGNDTKTDQHVLSHDDMKAIVADAAKNGSLKEAVEAYALAHGIENLDVLFPEAKALTTTPEWDKRRTEWVSSVIGGANKTPFSKVKTWTADITFEQARARGYIKGNMKKEEFFSISKRETGPQTVYKKQKLDRDDIIDITDFDVVAWMKGEMRLMLDEEIGRAILVGDGREIDDDDKIQEDKIRPIASDDDYYTIKVDVNISDSNSSMLEVFDAVILNRQYMKGSGTPTFFTTENFIARALLLREPDTNRRMYRTVQEIAAELRVDRIVPVEILEDYPDIIGIMVNMRDYNIGADRGGAVALFDDFDIDYNQYKYLIETRISGALTKPKAAMVIRSTAADAELVVATEPGYDSETNTVTIPTVEGVVYTDRVTGNVLTPGNKVLTAGQTMHVEASADDGYYLAGGKRSWSYIRPSA